MHRWLWVPLVLLCVGQANADPIIFTNRAAFEAAIGTPVIYDFSKPQQPAGATIVNGAVWDHDYLRYQLIYGDMTLFVDSSDGGQAFSAAATGQFGPRDKVATMEFVAPRTAIGFDIVQAGIRPLEISGAGFNATITQMGFLGFIWDTPTNQLFLSPVWQANDGTSPNFLISNVTTSVPEPSTLVLGGMALALIARRRRRAH